MKHVYEKLGLDKPNKERGEGFFEKELIWTKAEVIQIHTFKRLALDKQARKNRESKLSG